jgi:hypothetical protein
MQRHQLQPPHLRSNQDSETCSPLNGRTLAHGEHMKPIATLSISTRPTGVLLYELRDATGAVLWQSLGYSSESGRERVRVRLRAWLVDNPYRVVLAPDAEARRSA